MTRTILVLTLAVAFAATSGCGKNEETKKEETASTKVKTVNVSAELEDRLAAADAADGETDKTISKCYCCGLGMAGKAEHSVKVNGYTAHFCADRCSTHFEEKATEVINETRIPKTEDEGEGETESSENDETVQEDK